MTFDEAFATLIGNEGGLSLDQNDTGNWTGGEVGRGILKGSKFGISAASYPNEDIANLTLDRAKAIYARDYWAPAGCDRAPEAVRFDLFDMSVNSGVRPAIKALQCAAGTAQDGILGPQTLAAANAMPGAQLLARFNGARLIYMTSARQWPTQGRGWANRIANNLLRV